MVFKHFNNLRNSSAGVTLIEVVFVVFLVGLFSVIMISDFPRIQKQFALSRETYKLAQDLRKAENLGLSGVQQYDANGVLINVKGYGVYFNIGNPYTSRYIIYADVDGNNAYAGLQPYENYLCSKIDAAYYPDRDCIVEIGDVSEGNPGLGLYIKKFEYGITGVHYLSINFSPPNPIVSIDNRQSYSNIIGITLGLASYDSSERTVEVNTSGLINVK